MQLHVSLLQPSRLTTDGTHLPLRRLALCLDCDECFELGCATCPACGSRTWSPLARFIDLLSEPRAHRVVGSGRKGLPSRAATTADKGVPRYLLVVARHQPEFYDAIQRAFAGHETVQVVLDRRVGQRRQRQGAFLLDRRRSDRRRTSAADEQLRTLGWSLVPLDVPKPRRA